MQPKPSPKTACTQDLSVYLHEVYALERKMESVWEERIAKIPAGYTNISDYLQGYVYQKKQHISALKDCLRRLSPDDAQKSTQDAQYIADIGLQMAADNINSDAFCNTALERFETAIYRRIIDCARQAGQDDIAEVCETILRQEEEVARWLEHALREIPLQNSNAESSPEVAQGEGFLIDARLMQLRHPETTPDEGTIKENQHENRKS